MFQSLWGQGPPVVTACGGVCEEDLLRAASGNSVEPLKRFAEAGGALHHVRDNEKRTLLHVAAFDHSSDVLEMLLQSQKMVQLVNIKDKAHRTALHLAAAVGDETCARRLVEMGAAQDQRDEFGCTPLHHCVKWDHAGTVRVLLDLAADPSLEDASGRSAADIAENASKDVADLLRSVVPRKKPTTLDGLRCCLRPRRAPARRSIGEEPCDHELSLQREVAARAPASPQAPLSPQTPPTPQVPASPRAQPSPRTLLGQQTPPAPRAPSSPRLPAPGSFNGSEVIPPPPVLGRSPERDPGRDQHNQRSRDQDRSHDREGYGAMFKVSHRVRVRDSDKQLWQLGRVTSVKPLKVQTDTATLSFAWAQVERVKDEHDGSEDEASSTSEDPPPPPPLPAEGRTLNADDGGTTSENLSAFIAEAAKRRAGSPPASPPRQRPKGGLGERSSASEGGYDAEGKVEWHGLEPVYKARAASVAGSGSDAKPSDGQERTQEVPEYWSLSAPPEQPQLRSGFEEGTPRTTASEQAVTDSVARDVVAQGGGSVSESEVFSESDESAKSGEETSSRCQWSMEQSFLLAGDDILVQGLVPLMDSERCSSVRDAVDQLNGGSIEVPGGICLVFSSARSAYFLLYRRDQKEYALTEFGDLPESTEASVTPRAAEVPAELISIERPRSPTSASPDVSQRPSKPLIFRFRGYFSESVPRLEFEVEWKGNPPMVGRTKPGGAAEVRGIMTGDLISEVNGVSTADRSRDELLPMLKHRPLLLSVDRVYDDMDERETMFTLELVLEDHGGCSNHGMDLSSGSIVVGVREASPAWVSGVMVGDAIIADGGDALSTLRSARHTWPLVLKLQRAALNNG